MIFYKKSMALGASLLSFYLLYSIATSTQSTSVVALIYTPLFALIGAFLGNSLAYFYFLAKKRAVWNPLAFFGYLALWTYCLHFPIAEYWAKNHLAWIENQERTESELLEVLQKHDSKEAAMVAKHPKAQALIIKKIIEEYPGDYYVLNSLLDNRHMQLSDLETLITHFPGHLDQHYQNIYQTYVLAKIVSRPHFNEQHHRLIMKTLLQKKWTFQPFLVLALLRSPYLRCEDLGHLPTNNNPSLQQVWDQAKEKNRCP